MSDRAATIEASPSALAERARERRRKRPTHHVRKVLIYSVLIVTSVIMLGPFFWMLSTSFKPAADTFASPPKLIPSPWTLQNYRYVLTNLSFARYFLNSVIVTGSIVTLNVVLGTAAAYAFAKLRFPGRNALFFLLLVTLMVPFQVNLIPLFRMMVGLHNINSHLGVDSYSGLILPGMVQVFGIFLMRQFLQSNPDEVLESARVDGASEFRILRSIVFPMAAPGMATLAIFVFLEAWNDFLWPLIVISDDAHKTLTLGLAALETKNAVIWGNVMAGTALAAVPMILVFLLLQRRFIEGLTAGAVKG